MPNINKLRGKIIETGKDFDDMAEILGINRSTLYRKLSNNGETFTIREAGKLVKALCLSPEDAFSIFFTQRVPLDGTS